jgi:hypothetical protein
VINMQFYDPAKLIRDVQVHLQLQGIDAEVQPGQTKEAAIAAGALLNALGVTPAMDGRDALARAMDKPWPQGDE